MPYFAATQPPIGSFKRMATLERAIEIAARAHAGVEDKAHQPYLLHPLRMVLALRTTDERIVAALHDVVEDANWTLEQLRAEGFSDAVIAAVDALTKRPRESRMEAAQRAAQNAIARHVKLADLTDNMDLSRIDNPGPRDYARIEEYREIRAFLERAVGTAQ